MTHPLPFQKVLVVSAHADDESFGIGGTLHRLKKQKQQKVHSDIEIHWLIGTRIWSPKWPSEHVAQRESEIQEVGKRFGMDSITHWDYPDNKLETYPLDELQSKFISLLEKLQPDTLFTPGPWDFNHEHRLLFELVEMCTKPAYSPYLNNIYAYEIPSSTEWRFQGVSHRPTFTPSVYIDIEDTYEEKIQTCKLYHSELYAFPHSRSIPYLDSLSRVRGAESGLQRAEAFQLCRQKH